MPNKIEYLIDTDISVIQASELYFNSFGQADKLCVYPIMRATKVLGIHSRYNLNISNIFNKVATTRNAVVCSVAKTINFLFNKR